MKGKSGEFNQISYQNEYIKEKYDRINLTVPKGRKEEIKKKAAAAGQSVRLLITTNETRQLLRAAGRLYPPPFAAH